MKLSIANYPQQIQNFDWSKLPAVQKEVFQTMKDGSDNFKFWEEWSSDSDIKPVLQRHIDILNKSSDKAESTKKKVVKKTGAKKMSAKETVKASAPKKAKKVKATSSAKPKPAAKAKSAKTKTVVKKEVKPKKTEQQKVEELKKEVESIRKQVVENAKFKDKLGEELTTFLKKKGLSSRVGLGDTADAMKVLKEKKKFYSNLLSGDIQDFKTIGKRLGIIYRKAAIKKSK